MSRILVFGATGRTGRHFCVGAVETGHEVIAVRHDTPLPEEFAAWIDALPADVTAPGTVEAALRQARPGIVVNLAGGHGDRRVDGDGGIAISRACEAAGVDRLILVTSLGCGDSRAFASDRLIEAIGPVLEAKTRAEEALRRSALAWTIIRPGGLTDGPGTGQGALYDDPATHGRIACADLAALLIGIVGDAGSTGRVLAAVDRTSMHGAEPQRRYRPST